MCTRYMICIHDISTVDTRGERGGCNKGTLRCSPILNNTETYCIKYTWDQRGSVPSDPKN